MSNSSTGGLVIGRDNMHSKSNGMAGLDLPLPVDSSTNDTMDRSSTASAQAVIRSEADDGLAGFPLLE